MLFSWSYQVPFGLSSWITKPDSSSVLCQKNYVTSLLLWRNNFSAGTSPHLFMGAMLASLAINSSYCEHNIIPLKMIHFTVRPNII